MHGRVLELRLYLGQQIELQTQRLNRAMRMVAEAMEHRRRAG